MLQHLQQRNRSHFGQAHGTPFTIPPLVDNLGFTSDTPLGSMILDGTYDVTHLDHTVQTIIPSAPHDMFTATAINTNHITIQVSRENQQVAGININVTVRTTLGHYKAMTSRHEFSDISDKDPWKAEFESQRSDIIKLHLQLLNCGLDRGTHSSAGKK
jgi:hypothetical protein